MEYLLWAIPLAPLIAMVVCATLSITGRGKDFAHIPAALGLLVSAACAVLALLGSSGGQSIRIVEGYSWLNLGRIQVPINLRVDALGFVQIFVVTFVSFLVVVYSAGYMKGDKGYARYFAAFSGFVFSMTMLVLSSNLIVLYAFWEGVGLCSYLLIGFWFQRPSAAKAAMKAFLVNRVADCGFLIGVLTLWYAVGLAGFESAGALHRLDYDVIFEAIPKLAADENNLGLLTFIGFMLLTGAVGKSAQFPLHVWLPDAMEGPTPVSALIHAATMVTAGIFLLARMSPLLAHTPSVLIAAGWLGSITALLAALIALGQDDLKRVLAYSTVSQLGYMFMALGAGSVEAMLSTAVIAAMFHLLTHAFFKALLFLSAGNVMHAMGDVIDMRRFSGLRKVLPGTHALFAIGTAALAGVPPLAGFWSKDGILGLLAGVLNDAQHGTAYTSWLVIGLTTALLTSIYSFRAYFRTFFGEEKFPKEAGDHPHEATALMLSPMWVLAIGSIVVGMFLGPTSKLNDYIGMIPFVPVAEHHGEHANWVVILSAVLAISGAGVAWVTTRPGFSAAKFGAPGKAFIYLAANRFFLDEIYTALIVVPVAAVAKILAGWDIWGFDQIWQLVCEVPRNIGRGVRMLQTGMMPAYSVGFAVGVLALVMLSFMAWFA